MQISTETGKEVGDWIGGQLTIGQMSALVTYGIQILMSLMMISFNLFGNGLRDAFNQSLRGVEE